MEQSRQRYLKRPVVRIISDANYLTFLRPVVAAETLNLDFQADTEGGFQGVFDEVEGSAQGD